MKLIESKTYKNLARAYAGECMAQTRYKFIEYGARKEGFVTLAEVIDTIIYQEFNHARMLYTFIETASDGIIPNIDIAAGYPFKEKWNLQENLKLAAEDEAQEAEIYADFEKTARKEGFEDVAGLFKNLIQVENCHKMLFEDLYNQMHTNTLYKRPQETKWKCSACGYEQVGKSAFKVCPLCQAKQGAVMLKLTD